MYHTYKRDKLEARGCVRRRRDGRVSVTAVAVMLLENKLQDNHTYDKKRNDLKQSFFILLKTYIHKTLAIQFKSYKKIML